MAVLADVAEIDDIDQHADAPLYDLHLLDSLKTVELIVAFCDEFGIELSPAEIDRSEWATPRKIAAYIEGRVPEGRVQA
jgi:D-alanine--poly(phosphoribitol) ligase subunit 2